MQVNETSAFGIAVHCPDLGNLGLSLLAVGRLQIIIERILEDDAWDDSVSAWKAAGSTQRIQWHLRDKDRRDAFPMGASEAIQQTHTAYLRGSAPTVNVVCQQCANKCPSPDEGTLELNES